MKNALSLARDQHGERLPREVEDQITVETLRALVDDYIAAMREVARVAAVLHGTPRLGKRKSDPVDELIYIILSRKTREEAYQTYAALRERFPSWDDVLAADPADVERLVSPGGLGEKKALSVLGALKTVKKRFGSCTLEPARSWSDAELEGFLVSFPRSSARARTA